MELMIYFLIGIALIGCAILVWAAVAIGKKNDE